VGNGSGCLKLKGAIDRYDVETYATYQDYLAPRDVDITRSLLNM